MALEAENIFIVGIKGTAMSNLAVILARMGKKVAGCDVEEEFITDPILAKYRIPFSVGFDASTLPEDTDLVVYSAAHGGSDNPVVKAALSRGVKAVPQAQVLGELLSRFETSIAVSGCHGKTTTTSLMAFALKNLKANPAYLIGAPFFNGLPGGGYGRSDRYFVIEADEYGINPPADRTPKLLFLKPTHIICTNIDFDHPDVYDSLDETKKTFRTFFEQGRLYLCWDDENVRDVAQDLPRERFLSYGFSPEADMRVVSMKSGGEETAFDLSFKGKPLGTFSVSLYGQKNVTNAAGAVAALIDLGFSPDDVRGAIKGFASVKRRFELVYGEGETKLFDDYGHHPAEIAATIQAARARFAGRRIGILFQPHTFSRTKNLKTDFARALGGSDYCIVAPIFASAREKQDSFDVSSFDIEKEAAGLGLGQVKAAASKEQAIELLKSRVRRGDVVFTVGAGDIYKLKDDIIRVISTL